jgi:DNA replication protein DnaC
MELTTLLAKLKMEHLEVQLDAVCEQAAHRELDYKSFLAQALETEWKGRFQRGIEARLRQSRFPWIKTLDQFDFDFQPSLDRRQVRELAGLSFVERAHNVVILGPPGVGKTQPA